ncbi:MAG TPA: UDP-N-acetylglucosamine 2-epimerase, partial [Candidatus Eremiobacteraceae bacterium]|nr:UDP-N-acetylglucosamine 2-epimerase [Candidatus Eremiobacteraceae bacterium]
RVVGDLMVDLAAQTARTLTRPSPVLERFGVRPGEYGVATIHRASNTDEPAAFARLVQGMRMTRIPIVFPIHPRSRELAHEQSVGAAGDTLIASDPLPYADMIALMRDARVILTDSGGIQKEALVLGVPCVTLRTETEWTETLNDGWNALAGGDPVAIARLAERPKPRRSPEAYYGAGDAAMRTADALLGVRRPAEEAVAAR